MEEPRSERPIGDDGGGKNVKLYLSIDEDELIEHAKAANSSVKANAKTAKTADSSAAKTTDSKTADSKTADSSRVWKLSFPLTSFKYQLLFCQADKIIWIYSENNYELIFTMCQKLYSQYNQCLPFTFTLDKNGNKTNTGHYPEIPDEIAEMSDIEIDEDLEDDLYIIIYNNKKQQIKYSVTF